MAVRREVRTRTHVRTSCPGSTTGPALAELRSGPKTLLFEREPLPHAATSSAIWREKCQRSVAAFRARSVAPNAEAEVTTHVVSAANRVSPDACGDVRGAV